MIRRAISGAGAFLLLAACGTADADDESTEAARRAAAEDSVETATLSYDDAAFDSIEWESDAVMLERGAVVWEYSCQKCHGVQGDADTVFVTQGDTLDPPSFVDDDWTYAGDEQGLQRRIFTGTPGGMPHWGLEGLKYRDIQAVSAYINRTLRASNNMGVSNQ